MTSGSEAYRAARNIVDPPRKKPRRGCIACAFTCGKKVVIGWRYCQQHLDPVQVNTLLRQERMSARQRAALVVVALRKYGQHTDACNTIMGWGADCPCDCGLNALILELDQH